MASGASRCPVGPGPRCPQTTSTRGSCSETRSRSGALAPVALSLRAASEIDLAQAELAYAGWLSRLLTHPVQGLRNYQQLMRTLTVGKGAIKVFCKIAPPV